MLVRDAQYGAAIGGATVRIGGRGTSRSAGSEGPDEKSRWDQRTTDDLGMAEFCGDYWERVQVAVERDGYLPTLETARLPIGTQTVDLTPGFQLRVVTRSRIARVLENVTATVYATVPGPGGPMRSSWSANLPRGVGSVTLPAWELLEGGSPWIWVVADGHAGTTAPIPTPLPRELIVDLEASHELQLTVIDGTTGRPVDGADLEGARGVRGTTDTDGRVLLALRGWRSGTSLVLTLMHPDYAWTPYVISPMDVAAGSAELRVDPGHVYPVRFVDDATNAPIPEVHVDLREGEAGSARQWSATNGQVRLPLAFDRLYVGSVTALGFGTQFLSAMARPLAEGEPVQETEVRLKSPRDWRGSFVGLREGEMMPAFLEMRLSLVGHLLPTQRADGLSRRTAQWRGVHDATASVLVRLDAAGNFLLRAVPPGSYSAAALTRVGDEVGGLVLVHCASGDGPQGPTAIAQWSRK